MTGQVILVGAGPGAPDLISLRGLKAIERADVILYDALVSEELLTYASAKCISVYVGKRKGRHAHRQEEINALLLYHARRAKIVVRLKGGDPYIFGRGHEERSYLESYGVSVDVIPGISSVIAGPQSIGIPLTKRGLSESFWVVTGTTTSGEISSDLRLAAQSTATIVVLMGLAHIEEIAEAVSRYRSPLEPVAVVESASLKEQRSIKGNANSIATLVEEQQVSSPAIIIIGKVVATAEIIAEAAANLKVAV